MKKPIAPKFKTAYKQKQYLILYQLFSPCFTGFLIYAHHHTIHGVAGLHSKPILKIAAPVLALITLLAVISASALVVTQTATTPKDKADALFKLFENANSTSVDLFNQLKAAAIAIPQASLTQYAEAQNLANEGTNLYQAGNYVEASNKVLQALQKLEKNMKTIYETTNVQQTQTEIDLERTRTINSSITRFREQLRYMENLTLAAQRAGFNVSSFTTKIEKAELLLKEALSNLIQEQYVAAEDNLNEAKSMILDLTDSLSNLSTDLRTQRLEAYIAETEQRLNVIKAEATSAANTASLIAVNQAETSLNNAKTYFEQSLVNASVTELSNAKESENEAVAALQPSTTSSITSSITNTTSYTTDTKQTYPNTAVRP
jgi:chemotaxis regulatin CheY-phosphate phosphatase CheZ